MPQPQYLSTDPTAGDPVQQPGGYLSTDPMDGEPNFRTSNETDAEGNPVVRDSAASRFGSNFLQNILPSTTPSDYIEGPKYAVQHPMDSIGLLAKALWDAHAGQAGKTVESAKRVISEPSMAGKFMAADETFGHGLATILPLIGPAAANAGEQIGSGDIAGGLGATTGILSPFAAKPAGRLTAPIREWGANKLHTSAIAGVEKAINPTRVDTKVQTARIAPEMLKRRVRAGNLQKLEDLAEGKSAQAGAKVDEALTPFKDQTSDTMALVDELEKAKAQYTGTSTTGAKVINDPQRVKAIQKLQDTLMEYGDNISVESMVQLRRNWDEIVNAGKGFTTPKAGVKAGAARSGRTVLREELKKAVPDLDKVNKEYSFWQTLEDITHASNQRKTGQKGNFVSTVAGGAGAVVGEMVIPGSGLVKGGLQAVLGAKLFSSFSKFVNSPGWQLWSAVQKERLADALMAKDTTRVQGLIHQGMIAAGAGSRAAGRVQSGRPVPQVAETEPPLEPPPLTKASSDAPEAPSEGLSALSKATGISRGRSQWQEAASRGVETGIDVLMGALGVGPESKSNLVGQLVTAGVPFAGARSVRQALKAKKGIKAYHGSPHDFDEFKSAQIGTGEGAQAYGHGLYFAENEGTAKWYRDNFQSFKDAKVKTNTGEVLNVPTWVQARMDEGRVDSVIDDFTGRLQEMHDKKASSLQPWLVDDQIQNTERILKAAHAFKSGQAKTSPAAHMYEVNIDASPEDFLDWETPLSQQSEKVKGAVAGSLSDFGKRVSVVPSQTNKNNWLIKVDNQTVGASNTEAQAWQNAKEMIGDLNSQEFTGREAYQALARAKSKAGAFPEIGIPNPPEASGVMKQAGIPGIKYLDGASRSAGQGSRNYVVFDDKLISILKKYGIAGAITSGALESWLQQQATDPARKGQSLRRGSRQ